MNTRIAWIHQPGKGATYRYRAVMPAAEVGKINGFKTSVNAGEADILVFSKPIPYDIEMAKQAKAAGCKIVVDLADDHFDNPTVSRVYHDVTRFADKVVTPTPVMADRVKQRLGLSAEVIAEPYEFDELQPHANGEKYLWFGHKGNLKDIIPWKSVLDRLDFTVVSVPNQYFENTLQWSIETMEEQLALCNIVVLPTRKHAHYKSANRLINAIRMGCFVVADQHPAYKEFRRFAWTANFPTGMRWHKVYRDELNDMVSAGQDYIRDRYSPAAIGKQWADLLGAL